MAAVNAVPLTEGEQQGRLRVPLTEGELDRRRVPLTESEMQGTHRGAAHRR